MHAQESTSPPHTLSVVVMTVATIIENFQKTLMLDIIHRVFEINVTVIPTFPTWHKW